MRHRTLSHRHARRLACCILTAAALPHVSIAAEPRDGEADARHDQPLRKVVVGTTMANWPRDYPGLEERQQQMCTLIDEMAASAKEKYGRSLDLAVFAEYALTVGKRGSAAEIALPLNDEVLAPFAAKAREHHTYLVVTGVFAEDAENRIYSNAAVLLDRNGQRVGIYRKVHPVADPSGLIDNDLENGTRPGSEHAVFDCDFGKLGIQICYDIEYDDGWQVLKDKGAELVVFPSASPQLLAPAMRAWRHRYWVVSATMRHNATFFEPTGLIAAQIKPPDHFLVHEIDLSWLILPWSPVLENGRSLQRAFGDRVGCHYSEADDRGLFWSNDPQMTIGDMARELNLMRTADLLERSRRLQDEHREGPIH